MTFDEVYAKTRALRDDRSWAQFHNPKDLAISISLEASELLECFQWSGSDTDVSDRQVQMADELADVMVYCLYMADVLGVDPLQAISKKLDADAEKYPIAKAKGSSRKYTAL